MVLSETMIDDGESLGCDILWYALGYIWQMSTQLKIYGIRQCTYGPIHTYKYMPLQCMRLGTQRNLFYFNSYNGSPATDIAIPLLELGNWRGCSMERNGRPLLEMQREKKTLILRTRPCEAMRSQASRFSNLTGHVLGRAPCLIGAAARVADHPQTYTHPSEGLVSVKEESIHQTATGVQSCT